MDKPERPIYIRANCEERARIEFIARKRGLRKISEAVRQLIKEESDRLGFKVEEDGHVAETTTGR